MENTDFDERYGLAAGRVSEIAAGAETKGMSSSFVDYFRRTAEFLDMMTKETEFIKNGGLLSAGADTLRIRNHAIYNDILPENYGNSFANPTYAESELGSEYGPLLSTLYYEMRSVIPFIYDSQVIEDAMERVLTRYELFLEIYGVFETADEGTLPPASEIKHRMYDYLSDYIEDELAYDTREKLISDRNLAGIVIKDADFKDMSFLYRYGEYVSDDETGLAGHLSELPEEEIEKLADTYTEGYRIGFKAAGKPLDKKQFCSVYYHLGFERIMRKAYSNFAGMHLKVAAPRDIPTVFRMLKSFPIGITGAAANPQYLYDHREDLALFLDARMAGKRLEALETVYDSMHDETVTYAGPAVMETFGEDPFSPVSKKENVRYNAEQQKTVAGMNVKAMLLYNDAVVAKERSFTIISFPVPSIADSKKRYNEIFDAVIEINTLDYHKYQKIQACIIDALNDCERVEIKGMNGSRTDMNVELFRLTDPSKQAIFENCVADVNIPVGEVFTSPRLKGTNGLLHVTGVYLEGLYFKDLWLKFEDGCTVDYGCGNFEDLAEGRKFIEENILFHHEKLPIGEFAIGTNTTAYAYARKYGFNSRLTTLIGEKTGPHFAVGDTCYSSDEDNSIINPDGKEIVAKENEISALRKTDPDKAYFGCHTDITLPYSELGLVCGIRSDGSRVTILENGRFVLRGTEELNVPLDK